MSQTSVTIVGNLTRDPELKFIPSGRAVANFGVAHTPRRNNNGTWEDMDPEYYDVAAWGTLAENIADTFSTGMRVVLTGHLKFDQWENDGQKRSKVSVVATSAGPDLTWATATVEKNAKGGNAKPTAAATANTNPFEDTDF